MSQGQFIFFFFATEIASEINCTLAKHPSFSNTSIKGNGHLQHMQTGNRNRELRKHRLNDLSLLPELAARGIVGGASIQAVLIALHSLLEATTSQLFAAIYFTG